MTTIRKIAAALAVAAGLLASPTALAGDASSERHLKHSQSQQAAAAAPAKADQVQAAKATDCSCAHKS